MEVTSAFDHGQFLDPAASRAPTMQICEKTFFQQTPAIFLLDDDKAVQNCCRATLLAAGLDMLTVPSAEQFLADYSPSTPGSMILSMQLPGLGARPLLEILHQRRWNIPVIATSAAATIQEVVWTMKHGVIDFFEKPVPPLMLMEKLRHAVQLDAARRLAGQQADRVSARLVTLTGRERELLDLIVAGHSNKQVAMKLHISVKTVENHRARVMRKTGAGNAAELVRLTLCAA
jgi:two-component system CheB/CheR fusion protein